MSKHEYDDLTEGLRRENAFVWTKKDVARELNVSVRHIDRLVTNDRIPFAKVGRLVRFCPSRIREWLEKGGTR